jgi:hypothetical protein
VYLNVLSVWRSGVDKKGKGYQIQGLTVKLAGCRSRDVTVAGQTMKRPKEVSVVFKSQTDGGNDDEQGLSTKQRRSHLLNDDGSDGDRNKE